MPSNCTIISWKGKKEMASLLKGSKGGGVPVARSGSGPGPGPGRRFPVFPTVDAASPRGLSQPPGLSALGCQGSVRDRLTPPGRVEGFRPRELYSIAALARYGAFGAIFYTAFSGRRKTDRPRSAQGNAFPLWWLSPPPSPRKRWDYGCLAMEP